MTMIAPQPKEDYKYIKPTGLYATTLTACTAILVNNAAEDELVFDIDATGAGNCIIEFDFIIPADFKAFAGQADDISIRATQDLGASNDSVITINAIDSGGNEIDDDSVAAQDLSNVFATYDCAIDAGAFVVGDHITIQITTTNPANDDDCMITIPKLKYIPQ
nr:MAG: hypothetical protein [uncultured archaeon]